jgi:hypothetical protein
LARAAARVKLHQVHEVSLGRSQDLLSLVRVRYLSRRLLSHHAAEHENSGLGVDDEDSQLQADQMPLVFDYSKTELANGETLWMAIGEKMSPGAV